MRTLHTIEYTVFTVYTVYALHFTLQYVLQIQYVFSFMRAFDCTRRGEK